MLFEIDKTTGVYYQVILADVVNANGETVRSFATSEQLMCWVSQQPDTTFNVVVNVRGTKLSGVAPGTDLYSSPYVIPTPGGQYCNNLNQVNALDVLCNRGIAAYGNGFCTQTGGQTGWG